MTTTANSRYHGKTASAAQESLRPAAASDLRRTFSKSLFPALRTARLVVPIKQIEPFRQQVSLMPCSVPLLWRQHTLADFIRDGHFWRAAFRKRCVNIMPEAHLVIMIEEALAEQGFVDITERRYSTGWLRLKAMIKRR